MNKTTLGKYKINPSGLKIYNKYYSYFKLPNLKIINRCLVSGQLSQLFFNHLNSFILLRHHTV